MIRKLIYCLLSCTFLLHSFAQKKGQKSYVFAKKLTNKYTLIFERFDPVNKLYANPVLLIKNKRINIKDFDKNNFTDTAVIISPNHQFLVMDYIVKGYVYSASGDSSFVENYHCVIVAISKAKIVMHLQSDCGGKWDAQNHWVNDDKIIF